MGVNRVYEVPQLLVSPSIVCPIDLLVRDQEVGGSNPLAPTAKKRAPTIPGAELRAEI